VPYLNDPLQYVGPNIHSTSAQVDCRPLAILNFHLPSLGPKSTAAITVHAALTPFFLPTPIYDISADLGHHESEVDSDVDPMVVDDPLPHRSPSTSSSPVLSTLTSNPIFPETDPKLYMYKNVAFNLGSPADINCHSENMQQLLIDLERSVHSFLWIFYFL